MTQGIRLIVGLGNVGAEYERTRHNAGFWFVDELAAGARTSFHPEKKFLGELARASIAGKEVWLLKPGTYMNRSGQSVQALAAFYRIAPGEILVAHDELDLTPGDVRLKQGGGLAGHNGLKDICARIGTPDFWRLRIGIGHPRSLGITQEVADFVLHPPRREEQTEIVAAIGRAVAAADPIVAGNANAAALRLRAEVPTPAGGMSKTSAGTPRNTLGATPAKTDSGR